jgi:hypothetical protein
MNTIIHKAESLFLTESDIEAYQAKLEKQYRPLLPENCHLILHESCPFFKSHILVHHKGNFILKISRNGISQIYPDNDFDFLEFVEDLFLEILPHGSGFNYKYDIEINILMGGRKTFVIKSAYQPSDEHGFYLSSLDFSIRGYLDNLESAKVYFSDNRRAKKLLLDDYIREQIVEAFSKLIP